VNKPADPAKDGFVFAGWSTAPTYNTPYDFSAPGTDNLTLYAIWTLPVTVSAPSSTVKKGG